MAATGQVKWRFNCILHRFRLCQRDASVDGACMRRVNHETERI